MTRSRPVRSGHHNLPSQGTALVGRDQEVSSLCQLVVSGERRLVTLTGVGGCGKTRLAFGVASNLLASFKDGVWLVTLAPLADPLLVPRAVASVLGVRERSDRPLLDVLADYLARRQLLLLLDNCEHLLQGCAALADTLLRGCPTLRLLATSREPLHISDEVAWRVPALGTPDPHSIVPLDELMRYPAAQLFVERATAAQSDFTLTARAAPALAAICARLEGLPLAIELAAPWVRVLGVMQILERLDDAFGLLVGGSRSAPSRQQTMRATLDWSYGLLTETERVAFEQLAVFVGGWSLEAAEIVCSGSGITPKEVLTLLTRLVDVSLVQVEQHDGRARYRLLEPVRQYAHERLVDSEKLDLVRRRHAAWCLSFAKQQERGANVGGLGRQAAHAALELEQDNLRAALSWCVEQGEAETGLYIGRAHWNLWVTRGRFSEGRAWLSQLAALPESQNAPAMRAVALSISASLAWRQGSYAEAVDIYSEALPLLRQAHDPWLLHSVLADLGYIAMHQGEYQTAQAHLDDALEAAQASGDGITEAIALSNLGRLALLQADYLTARARGEDSLVLARATGDTVAVSIVLTNLGHVLLRLGEIGRARRVVEECVGLQRRIGERFCLAYSLQAMGQIATAEGHYPQAHIALRESLHLRQELGDRSGIAESLESSAALAAAQAQSERAVHLAAAAARVRDGSGERLPPTWRASRDHWLGPVRDALGVEAAARAWDIGQATPLEQAVELALSAAVTPPGRVNRTSSRSGQQVTVLSRREQEVAALLAQGLSNRQIAEQLVIAERTVAAHIEHILNKLGCASRHQVGDWAVEHGLHS